MRKALIAAAASLFMAGCTTAGPYVTNISSGGNGELNVEKCAVKLNSFTGTISTTDCTSQSLTVNDQ